MTKPKMECNTELWYWKLEGVFVCVCMCVCCVVFPPPLNSSKLDLVVPSSTYDFLHHSSFIRDYYTIL